MIAEMLARGQTKVTIARLRNVHKSTIYRWLANDKELIDGAIQRQEAICQAALDQLDAITLADVKPTAETQFKAMMQVITRHEERKAREAGMVTKDDAEMLFNAVCEALFAMPEAKARGLEYYGNASNGCRRSTSGSSGRENPAASAKR